jgi:CRP-like cAMP-binding protein
MSELVGLLQQEPVFGCLTDDQRADLAGRATLRRFDKDEVVCRQGDSWPYVLYIASGGLRTMMSAPDGRNFVGWTWEPSEVFWSPTVFDEDPVPSTLEATIATSVYMWRGVEALRIVLPNEAAVRALLRRQTLIIRQRRQGIYNLAFSTLASRLARLLVDRVFASGESTVQRELTLGDMAEMIASSPEVVCRLLYQFQGLGAISINRASITLHERRTLENLILPD